MPPQTPPDRKTRIIFALIAAVVAVAMMGNFFWPILKDFLHAGQNGGHGSKVPLLVFGGFFLVMILAVLASVVRAVRQPQNLAVGRAATPASGGIAGAVFLFLFSLPFAGFGLFAVVQAFKKMSGGNWKEAAGLALFGLIFSGVGFGLMLGTVWSRKKTRQLDELKSRTPDQPWLWRPDWAAGKIKSSSGVQTKIMAIFALAFCGIGGCSAFFVLPKELHNGNYLALLVLLFPAAGIGFLIAVIRGILARRRFGDCFFEMASIPGALGGTLEGLIQTGARLRLEHGLHLKLSCIRRTVSGSGDNQSTHENVLWQDEKVFKSEADLPEPEPGRSGIPVFFKLPANQPECDARGNEAILWRLEAKAKMSGPDFSATFDVPVFKVAGAAVAEADEPDPTAPLQMPVEELRRDEHSKILVTDGPHGREFFFPAARNIGAAIVTTVFALVFIGVVVLTLRFHAPILFPIVFGLFGLLIFCFTFSLWFKSSRVTINSTGVTAVNHWLLFCRTRHFIADGVVRFDTKAGMQSGSQVFMDLKLLTRPADDNFAERKAKFQQTGQTPPVGFRVSDPSGVTIASGIPSAAEANWLVQEMTKALGRKP